jgi:hypothetical protein
MNKLNNSIQQEITKNNHNYLPTKSELSIVNTTINICQFPELVLDNIADHLTVNTLLNLRSVNKAMYNCFLPKIIDKLCNKNNFNNKVFSRESYYSKIKGVLYNVDPEIVTSIESYIYELDTQYDDNYKDKNKVEFAKFLFYKMHKLNNILPKTFATKKYFYLHEENKRVAETDPNYIVNFKLSTCGNYCLATTNHSEIKFYKVNDDFGIFELNSIKLERDKRLCSIDFTPENNLITLYTKYYLERNAKENYIILWELDFFDDSLDVKKIAERQTFYYCYKKLMITFHDTTLVELIKDENWNICLNICRISGNSFIEEISLNQLDKILFPIWHKDCNENKIENINDVSLSIDNKVLAIGAKTEYNSLEYNIYILARNNTNEEFKQEKICRELNDRHFLVTANLQFNSSGNVCIFRNALRLGVSVLKKQDDFWYPSMFLENLSCANVTLLPYEHNIMLVYTRNFLHPDQRSDYLKVIPLIKEKNKVTKDHQGKVIKHKNTKYYWQCDHYYCRGINGDDVVNYVDNKSYTFCVHPTGLATIAFYRKYQCIKIILPKKVSYLDQIKWYAIYLKL